MSTARLVIIAILAVGGYQFWTRHQAAAQADAVMTEASSAGFLALPMPVGVSDSEVVVFAPANCPSDAAQRAELLAQALTEKGVPFRRSQSASFDIVNPEPQAVAALERVMNGTIPIVFVRGKGKANPSLDEVLAEYRAGRSR